MNLTFKVSLLHPPPLRLIILIIVLIIATRLVGFNLIQSFIAFKLEFILILKLIPLIALLSIVLIIVATNIQKAVIVIVVIIVTSSMLKSASSCPIKKQFITPLKNRPNPFEAKSI